MHVFDRYMGIGLLNIILGEGQFFGVNTPWTGHGNICSLVGRVNGVNFNQIIMSKKTSKISQILSIFFIFPQLILLCFCLAMPWLQE